MEDITGAMLRKMASGLKLMMITLNRSIHRNSRKKLPLKAVAMLTYYSTHLFTHDCCILIYSLFHVKQTVKKLS